ncbi:GH92 family glycosyl hydrolase [Kitasatospora sp. NPDC058965]|uniref:GH92 family glycosyl hydrolase n=1 Tax=Kitasatospora sp. NPDC058965 TaxID=3346682 RepID=UPI0036D1D5C0
MNHRQSGPRPPAASPPHRTPRPSRSRGAVALAAGAVLATGGALLPAHPAAAAVPAVARTTVDDPAQYVNPLVGTQQSATDYGNGAGAGNTYPGAAAPLGMVQWSPDTVNNGYAASYNYNDNQIRGFSLTHISGAGCPDYGNLPFMPVLGTAPVGSATFSHANESASPGRYAVTLDNGIATTLAATQRSGVATFHYPGGATNSVTVDTGAALNPASGSITLGPDRISGYTDGGNFCGSGNHYRLYFTAVFDRPFSAASIVPGSNQKALLSFDTSTNATVTARVGISFVSTDGAAANLQAEQGSSTSDQVAAATRTAWNGLLGRIAVAGGTTQDTRTFYTALYHALLAPGVFSDTDGRYPGFDGQLHTAAAGHAQYADFSGWDVYRSQVQLLALLAPHEASDIAQSIVNQGSQAGYLDRWTLANSGTGIMYGDPLPVIGSSVYAFGATDFDYWGLLWQSWQGTVKENERPGQGPYLSQGYVPSPNWGAAASTTEEYAVADFAVSQLAGRLGHAPMHDIMLHRSTDWRNLFNPVSHYLQPRAADHSWPAFDPASQNGFAEGDSAQYTWMVPQNLRGLIDAMGGNDAAAARLDPFFAQLNAGPQVLNAYLGNEPSQDVPWVYDYAGRPYRTQAVVRQALTQLYSDAPGGEPGNDDLGQLSSWAVWAALGMYPETPGRAELALASPLFPSISITRENGPAIDISAPGATAGTPYVSALSVNGTPSTHPWLGEDFVAKGGTLQYALSATPSPGWGAAPTDAPPSFDVGPAAPATGPVPGPGGKCLDDNGGSAADGNRIQLWDCNGTPAQQWTVSPDGTLRVLGKCLDVNQGGTAAGSLVQLYGCNGTGAQQWWPKSDGTLVNTPSGRCLDVPYGDTGDGAHQLQIWDCNGGTNQQWAVPKQ